MHRLNRDAEILDIMLVKKYNVVHVSLLTGLSITDIMNVVRQYSRRQKDGTVIVTMPSKANQ